MGSIIQRNFSTTLEGAKALNLQGTQAFYSYNGNIQRPWTPCYEPSADKTDCHRSLTTNLFRMTPDLLTSNLQYSNILRMMLHEMRLLNVGKCYGSSQD
ncbi:hypothetical protein H9L39_10160 [Fusarium oxysporum f. sp. albedinis]|nr:hypothetical protein H9L39_10160 [Fusarium oxysporum f. sp. albedinis]